MGFERGTIRALARRPPLLLEAIRAWLAMRRKGGLRPARPYLEWRLFTAYGDNSATTSAQDLVYYLGWRRAMRAMSKGERAK